VNISKNQTARFLAGFGPIMIWGLIKSVSVIGTYIKDESNQGVGLLLYFLVFFLISTAIISVVGYKILPHFLNNRRGQKEAYGYIALVFLIYTLGLFIQKSIPIYTSWLEVSNSVKLVPRTIFWTVETFVGSLVVVSIRLNSFFFLQRISALDLQKEKTKAELNALRLQVNPHFLFNTLNNIYSLANKEEKQSAKMIVKLSHIMRYMIYDCTKDLVSLDREKTMIDNFMELQRLKLPLNANIDFFVAGIHRNIQIPPMILINFVENSFKHSDIETNPEGWVHISLEVSENHLNFRSENSQSGTHLLGQEGLGLNISKKLLENYYGGRHKLNIAESKNIYTTELIVEL